MQGEGRQSILQQVDAGIARRGCHLHHGLVLGQGATGACKAAREAMGMWVSARVESCRLVRGRCGAIKPGFLVCRGGVHMWICDCVEEPTSVGGCWCRHLLHGIPVCACGRGAADGAAAGGHLVQHQSSRFSGLTSYTWVIVGDAPVRRGWRAAGSGTARAGAGDWRARLGSGPASPPHRRTYHQHAHGKDIKLNRRDHAIHTDVDSSVKSSLGEWAVLWLTR